MKKLLALCGASLAVSTSLFAALPPLYQGIEELKTILADEKLGQLLQSGEVIEDISKNNDGYLITTNRHRLQAQVVYEPAARPGPAQFHIVFRQPAPQ